VNDPTPQGGAAPGAGGTSGVAAPPSASPPTQPPARSGLTHVPGLDGVRALCVLAVLAFHNGFGWAGGGFLGVSTFFTLSGYLIASLLLAERAATGRVDLPAFWRRRTRRLLPAALLAVALAVVFATVAGTAEQRAGIGGDALASLGYVANWWFLASEQTYAALFSAPSPLLHMWSLAIEEQFYLVLPLVMLAAAGRRWRATALIGVLLLVTLGLPIVLGAGDDWRYYATVARAPELLIGVLLALLLASGDRRQRLMDLARPAGLVVTTIVGVGALGVMGWLWVSVGTTTSWLYDGGFAAFALVSATLLVAAHPVRSPVARLLSLRPLRHLGLLSYGLYLYHWPIFLWLDPTRTGLDGWSLFTVRFVVSLALAEASYRLVEAPVRTRGVLALGPVALGARFALPALAIVVAGALLVAGSAPAPAVDFAAAERVQLELAAGPTTGAPGPVAPEDTTSAAETSSVAAGTEVTGINDDTLRVAMFGDSTALMAMFGFGRWSSGQRDVTLAPSYPVMGCGLIRTGARRWADGTVGVPAPGCAAWPAAWREVLRQGIPQIAFVQAGVFDAFPRRLDDGRWAEPGEPAWDDQLSTEMTEAVDLLAASGAYTVWGTMPPPNRLAAPGGRGYGLSEERLQAVAAYNAVVRRLPELRPGRVEVLDVEAWHASLGDDDYTVRPDGLHLGTDGSDRAAAELYGPALRDAWARLQTTDTRQQLLALPRVLNGIAPRLQPLAPDDALRIVVWGDVSANAATAEVQRWADRRGQRVEVLTVPDRGCGVTRPLARVIDGNEQAVPRRCRQRVELWEAMAAHLPHIVVISGGRWDDYAVKPWPEDRLWGIIEPPRRGWLAAEYGQALDQVRGAGAAVVLARTPDTDVGSHDETNRALERIAASPWRAPWLALTDLASGPLPAGAASPAPSLAVGLDRLSATLPQPS
jgi:peptidoglycan/LPS O-acetylase OafA/YrhL